MKNKGYTLLELLGVIVILSVLITLVFPSIINFIKKGNDTKEHITNDLIISAAEDYIKDNSSELYLTSGVDYCVSINTLIDTQYLTITLDDNLYSSKSVKVTYDEKKNYEIIDSNDCSICKLIDDADDSKTVTPGDKYKCKVKDDMEEGFENGYYFFVLGTNEDGTTNLIMERNIYYDSTNDAGKVATETNKGLVAWHSNAENHSYGPVTAMNYLYSATKDWDNVPNMVMDYSDENIDYHTQQKGTDGYGSIKTTDNITIITSKTNEETGRIENLKARLPRYDEVHGPGKCLTYEENGNKYGSCPLYLANYLYGSSHVTGEGLQNISGIKGYWTLSSYANYSHGAWNVSYVGCVDSRNVGIGSASGVRPVITIKNVIELN